MSDDHTDTEAILEAARAGLAPVTTDDGITHLRMPEGWQVVSHSTEPAESCPDRPAGTSTIHDLPGFLTRHRDLEQADGTSVIYADHDSQTIVAVLNDDGPTGPGWRDHRLVYALRPTLAWRYWVTNEGLHEQERFAEVIEDGIGDIVDPAGAVMLEVAGTFSATIDARFRRAANLRDGARQLVYEETIDAKAGAAGEVTLPETFTLAVAPFEGGDPIPVVARIRFRLRDGNLTIGYTLPDADRIAEQAFLASLDAVRAGVPDEVAVVLGRPPDPALPTSLPTRSTVNGWVRAANPG